MMRAGIGVAAALPLIVAALGLVAVTVNRASGREAIELSEREAFFSPVGDDNTFRQAWLSWHNAPAAPDTWFDRRKLADLGFDTSVDPVSPDADAHYARLLPREAFAAFELDGPAWQALRLRPDAIGFPRVPQGGDDAPERVSRLVLVDVSLDGDALAARYPDGRTHLVTAAVVSARRFTAGVARPFVAGMVDAIAPSRIHVPREWASALPASPPGTLPPRVTIAVRYGARLEPWFVGVQRK